MPFVRGFLRVSQRGGGGNPVDPEYGIDEGEPPQIEPPDPDDAPPEIWPPVMPGYPIQPLPPDSPIPPGAIWPRPPGSISGKFVVLAHLPQHGWRWIVVDPDAWPEPPLRPEPKK